MFDSKKNDIVMLEQTQTRDDAPVKPVPIVGKVDYSGAYEKTDPREIALVKKLDRWIMPMLWSMYWLNYLGKSMFLRHSLAEHTLTSIFIQIAMPSPWLVSTISKKISTSPAHNTRPA
jgi:hypothetical protein